MNTAQNVLSYTESGRGDAILLLDWMPWQTTALADALTAQYRVISVEPPGPGNPDAAQNPPAAVTAVADAAGLQSCTLIGVSAGADVAFRLALLHPSAVDALILVSPTCVGTSQHRPADAPAQAADAMLAHPENAPGPPSEARTAALVSMMERRPATPGNDDAAALLSQLQCPALAIFGQEDRIAPPETARLWRELAPNCNICFVYDAGHAVGIDRPEALISVVSDFVRRRETFIVENRSGLINP